MVITKYNSLFLPVLSALLVVMTFILNKKIQIFKFFVHDFFSLIGNSVPFFSLLYLCGELPGMFDKKKIICSKSCLENEL